MCLATLVLISLFSLRQRAEDVRKLDTRRTVLLLPRHLAVRLREQVLVEDVRLPEQRLPGALAVDGGVEPVRRRSVDGAAERPRRQVAERGPPAPLDGVVDGIQHLLRDDAAREGA